MRALRDEIAPGDRRAWSATLIEETGIRSLKIRHNNVLGYYIEVTANHHATMTGSDGAKARFIHRQTMANAMRFTTTELAGLETKIANAADRALAIELAIFDGLTAEAVGHADSIRAGAEALAVLDVSAALALLARKRGLVPAGGGRQPRLRHRRRPASGGRAGAAAFGRRPVRRQRLRPVAGRRREDGAIWLLTGPNMGGKSTFLRQNALIAILAQTGSFVPAQSAHIGVVDRLFSRVGASDDLARGRSTFMVEMVETAAILNQAGERALVILDEIGRGTATFDGLSIAWAAVEYLHEKNRCRAIFATHFHEMTALAGKLPRLAQRHHAGQGVGGRRGLPARGRQGCRRPLLRRPGGAARRTAGGRGRRAREGGPAPVGGRRGFRQGRPAGRRPAAVFGGREAAKHRSRRRPMRWARRWAAINPDEMTPREALEALYRLKGLATKQ